MKKSWILLALLPFLGACQTTDEVDESPEVTWSEVTPVPDDEGFGGPFVGTLNGKLIVAGGANFPDGRPWEGGAKVWYDGVYALETPTGEWSRIGSLPVPLAYGTTTEYEESLILVGGHDATQAFSSVWKVTERGDELDFEALPNLPHPSAFHASGLIGSQLYVASGIRSLAPGDAPKAMWSIDLGDPSSGWSEHETWPGPSRVKAIGIVQKDGHDQNYFHLISGETPIANPDGTASRTIINNAFRFHPDPQPGESAWTPIASPPHPVAAGTGVAVGQSHLLVISGLAEIQDHLPASESYGFSGDVLAYHTITDTWTRIGAIDLPVVTTTAAIWNGKPVIASGEIRPGIRTNSVVQLDELGGDPDFGWINWIIVGLYLTLLVGMGLYLARRTQTSEEFFLAGKRLPWWAIGISIYVTQLSAITFISFPAVAYSMDWMISWGNLTILLMTPVVVFFYLPAFRKLHSSSAYQYLEDRFNLPTRIFGSLSFIVFQLGRLAIVVFLPALALTSITGINIYLCITLMGALSILYTVVGGMEAVVWTDVLQAVVLWGGLIAAFVIVLVDQGGFGPAFRSASDLGKLKFWDGSISLTEITTWSVLFGTFFMQFGPYTTDQAVIQRYMSASDDKAASKSVWLNGLLSLPFTTVFFILGTLLFLFFRSYPESLSVGMDNDQVFPLFIVEHMPTGISGLVIASIFAASMSSLDSSMHSVATVISTDFLQRFGTIRDDATTLFRARILVILTGLLGMGAAYALATFDINSVYFLFQSLLGLLGSGLAGVFFLGIFTKRANGIGALTGAAASTALLFWITRHTDVNFYWYAIMGMVTCVVVGYVTSLLTANRNEHEIAST